MNPKNPAYPFNPECDLILERTVDLTPRQVWTAWTDPEHLKQWFCPKPWSVSACEIDLRPGGLFRTVMRSPEGEDMPTSDGCFLEVEENQRLVWTSALGPDYRPLPPSSEDAFLFTAYILITPDGRSTRYTAIAVHPDEPTKTKHETMGFHEGWGIALDQLVEHMKQQSA